MNSFILSSALLLALAGSTSSFAQQTGGDGPSNSGGTSVQTVTGSYFYCESDGVVGERKVISACFSASSRSVLGSLSSGEKRCVFQWGESLGLVMHQPDGVGHNYDARFVLANPYDKLSSPWGTTCESDRKATIDNYLATPGFRHEVIKVDGLSTDVFTRE